MIGIYKITNKINHKIYIGQSICIEKRFKQHIAASKTSKLPLHQDIKIFGKDNFDFEVLEECAKEELNEKEKSYIAAYNSLVPNGYNLQKGGVSHSFEIYFNFSKDDILFIYDELKNTQKSYVDIAEEYNVSSTLIRYINYGIEYAQSEIEYPIRDTATAKEIQKIRVAEKTQGEQSYRATISEQTVLQIIHDLIYHLELTSVDIAVKYNVSIDIVKDINRCKSWKFIERPIPCRPDYGNHKITLEDAQFIIKILQTTYLSRSEIHKKYPQYSLRMIDRINSGENWHQDNIDYPIRKYKIIAGKLSTDKVIQICELLLSNKYPFDFIAKQFNVSEQTIRDINTHKSYPYITNNYPNPIR